jgi:hypothetical protein
MVQAGAADPDKTFRPKRNAQVYAFRAQAMMTGVHDRGISLYLN